jgi:hypothetical protein
MWNARTKTDLMIEVWEKLDCESVGAAEIEAIETAVGARFGRGAVDSPMAIARILADEGAVLRHSEILRLFVDRRRPFVDEAAAEHPFDFESIAGAVETLRLIESERAAGCEAGSNERSERLRRRVLEAKARALSGAGNPRLEPRLRAELEEIAGWLTIWLQTPEIFENWLRLRTGSPDFRARFPELADLTI